MPDIGFRKGDLSFCTQAQCLWQMIRQVVCQFWSCSDCLSLDPSDSHPVPARRPALVLASQPLPHLYARALALVAHSSAVPLPGVAAASIRICCTCPQVSHKRKLGANEPQPSFSPMGCQCCLVSPQDK